MASLKQFSQSEMRLWLRKIVSIYTDMTEAVIAHELKQIHYDGDTSELFGIIRAEIYDTFTLPADTTIVQKELKGGAVVEAYNGSVNSPFHTYQRMYKKYKNYTLGKYKYDLNKQIENIENNLFGNLSKQDREQRQFLINRHVYLGDELSDEEFVAKMASLWSGILTENYIKVSLQKLIKYKGCLNNEAEMEQNYMSIKALANEKDKKKRKMPSPIDVADAYTLAMYVEFEYALLKHMYINPIDLNSGKPKNYKPTKEDVVNTYKKYFHQFYKDNFVVKDYFGGYSFARFEELPMFSAVELVEGRHGKMDYSKKLLDEFFLSTRDGVSVAYHPWYFGTVLNREEYEADLLNGTLKLDHQDKRICSNISEPNEVAGDIPMLKSVLKTLSDKHVKYIKEHSKYKGKNEIEPKVNYKECMLHLPPQMIGMENVESQKYIENFEEFFGEYTERMANVYLELNYKPIRERKEKEMVDMEDFDMEEDMEYSTPYFTPDNERPLTERIVNGEKMLFDGDQPYTGTQVVLKGEDDELDYVSNPYVEQIME